MRKVLCSLVLVFTVSAAHATLLQPADDAYFRLRRGGTLYIYDAHSRDFIESLAAYNESYRRAYDRSFHWRLDEEPSLILTSPRQQIANAWATPFPNLKTVWYPSGVTWLESAAESSWLLTLAAHETAHLYQTNAKGPTASRLSAVFGNPLLLFPFFPVFTQPNILVPNALLEGNSVLNESRLNRGGRLHSGEMRALLLAQVAAGDVNASRLINEQFKFPYGENAYVMGGYFQGHLAAKYGIEKTNSFFAAQGEHFLWPLILNKTFREHFGSSFYQEVHEFEQAWKGLASRQRASPGARLLRTAFVSPLNHDEQRIWWTASEGPEPLRLFVFDKTSRSLNSRLVDLPMGKVFFDGEHPLAAASEQHDLHHVEYSLYGEGAHFDPRYRSQIVTDQRAGVTVGFDAKESWLEGRILRNGETFDVGHSNPVLDAAGRVYYFRQNGAERLLYRDRVPVAKFDGFYGKLTEVTPDGVVYFIASTDTGSSLFEWRSDEVRRVLDSDRVIDARRIGLDEFLAVEITARGKEIVLARAGASSERPALYSYAFATENILPGKAADAAQTALDEKPYSAFAETRFSRWDLESLYHSDAGVRVFSALTFTDPLEFQSVSAGGAYSTGRDRDAFVEYAFTKYLPQLYTKYLYSEDWYKRDDGEPQRTHNHSVRAGVGLPVLRWRRWDARLDLALTYRREQAQEKVSAPAPVSPAETQGTFSSFQLSYSQPSPLGFFAWREFQLQADHSLDAEPGTWIKKHNTSRGLLSYRHGFPGQVFAGARLEGAWAEARDVRLEIENPITDKITLTRLSGKEPVQVKTAGLLRVEIHKVMGTPAYSPRWPLGFHRIAPFVTAQAMALDSEGGGDYPGHVFEYGFGADLELLLLHKFPVRVRFLHAVDARDPRADNQLHLGLGSRF